ncbi:MAG: hypothetical protein ACTSU2_11225 [Promethearchaeota archaeon]
MTLYELGLIKNGVLSYQIQFYHIDNINYLDPSMRTMAFDAIFVGIANLEKNKRDKANLFSSSMSFELFDIYGMQLDVTPDILKRKYRIRKNREDDKTEENDDDNGSEFDKLTIYLFAHKSHLSKPINKLLKKILKIYLKKYYYEDTSKDASAIKVNRNKDFINDILKICKDYYMSPIERIYNIFI